MLDARKLRRFAGREGEDRAGKRLEDQILRAIGEHRDENKDREPPRFWLVPYFHEGIAKRRLARRRSRNQLGASDGTSFDTPYADYREHHRRHRYRSRNNDQSHR